MVSLTSVTFRFLMPLTVVDGGSGVFEGTISETDQASQPSYVFIRPRHVLRTPDKTALTVGMVVKTPAGALYIVGDNGYAEHYEGNLWRSFRLFEPSGRYDLKRRTSTVDPITRIATEGTPTLIGSYYAAIEPMDRLVTDRDMRQNFDQQRFITSGPVQNDDIFANRIVTKLDTQLGLAIGTLT